MSGSWQHRVERGSVSQACNSLRLNIFNVHNQLLTSRILNMTSLAHPIPQDVNAIHTNAQAENQRLAILTCGISGSGKSTLARNICFSYTNFVRLSSDNHVYRHHGVYDVGYPASKYRELQEQAERELKAELGNLLKARKDVVLDMSSGVNTLEMNGESW